MFYEFTMKLNVSGADLNLPQGFGNLSIEADLGTVTLTIDRKLSQAQIEVAKGKLNNFLNSRLGVNFARVELEMEDSNE